MTKTKDMKKQIAKASDQELATLLKETHETLRAERFAAAGARPKDSNSPRKLRKTIARVLTQQRARELAK
jgi:ribosomal protein L29